MPTARKLLAGLALALTAISCSDNNSPTAPAAPDQSVPTAPTGPTAPRAGKAVLSGDVVQAPTTFTSTTTGLVYTVAKVQITKFSYVGGQLMVEGGLFDPDGNLISAFGPTAATLSKGGGPTQPTCPILDLDIGAIHLNLLGLVVDLAPVHLDITAQSGSGALLGNLLCALVGLLDQQSPLQTAITNLLNSINALLTGLLSTL